MICVGHLRNCLITLPPMLVQTYKVAQNYTLTPYSDRGLMQHKCELDNGHCTMSVQLVVTVQGPYTVHGWLI